MRIRLVQKEPRKSTEVLREVQVEAEVEVMRREKGRRREGQQSQRRGSQHSWIGVCSLRGWLVGKRAWREMCHLRMRRLSRAHLHLRLSYLLALLREREEGKRGAGWRSVRWAVDPEAGADHIVRVGVGRRVGVAERVGVSRGVDLSVVRPVWCGPNFETIVALS